MFKNSLKYRFVLAICIICFICLLIFSLVSFRISYNALLNESTQKMVEAAQKNAEKMNGWLNLQAVVIKGMSESFERTGIYDHQTIVSFMQSEKALYPYFLLFYIAYPDKKLISDNWVPPADFDCTKRAWYIGAVRKDDLYFSSPFLDANTKNMIITIANPVKRSGSFIGVFAADIDVAYLTELVSNTNIGGNSYAFLLDNHNNFIVHPNKDFQPTSKEVKNVAEVLGGKLGEIDRHIRNNSYNVFELKDYDGIDKYVVLSKLMQTDGSLELPCPRMNSPSP